jgi:cell division transport system ATP-binding protein
MLYLTNVSKVYKDETESLHDVSLTISPGEFVAIMGHSGSGKTTIMKLILAEEYPTNGTIFYESQDIHSLSRKDLITLRRKIGTIFQDFRLIKNKTVFENVAFAMEVGEHTDEDISEYVPHVLELVSLTHKMHSFPETLSGGEKQRLAIARAIIHQPELLLADEPTSSLDPESAEGVMRVLRKLSDLGTTIVMTTHTPDLAHKYARRFVHLEKGRIVKDDKHHHNSKIHV